MEDWDAAPDAPKVFSTKMIEGCDLFVLLVGNRLGHVPTGERRSITQLEYDHARRLGIEVLSFVLRESHSDDLDDEADSPALDKGPEAFAIAEWRKEILERHGAGDFDQSAQSIPIATSVARWLISRKIPLPINLSLSAILADHSRDVRGFFEGRFDLVKLAFGEQFGRSYVLPKFTIGTMCFDYAIVAPAPPWSQSLSSITYVRLLDQQDKVLDGAIGESMDTMDRFLDVRENEAYQKRLEMRYESLVAREDYRGETSRRFYEIAVIVGGRRNTLSKKEMEILRKRNAERGPLTVKTWDAIAEYLDDFLTTAR
jgi:hypothetical protein